jgi:hypothetical protein
VQRKTGRTNPSTEPKHTFAPRTEYVSQVQCTEGEKELLGNGIKYSQPENLTQGKICIEDLAISCEQEWNMTQDLKREPKSRKSYWTSRKILAGDDRKPRPSSRESSDSKQRSRERTLSSLRLTMGNTMVIVEKSDYLRKVESYIA